MRALLLEPDSAWLEDRRRRGIDRRDEVWDGVLHVVPPPSSIHQTFESDLEAVLRPIAHAGGLRVLHQLGVYAHPDSDKNYRVPDLVVCDPTHLSERGLEARAEIVIEILSPRDESREKGPFYAACAIPEYWLVHPVSRQVEVLVLQGDAYQPVDAAPDGSVRAPRLALRLRTLAGPQLQIAWAGGVDVL